jgi:hypothetical protein
LRTTIIVLRKSAGQAVLCYFSAFSGAVFGGVSRWMAG